MSWVIPRVIFCDVVTKEDLKGGGAGVWSIVASLARSGGFGDFSLTVGGSSRVMEEKRGKKEGKTGNILYEGGYI